MIIGLQKRKGLSGWERRKLRVRKKVVGTTERLRLNVYRSNKQIYAQLIDDISGKVILAASTLTKTLKDKAEKAKKFEAARMVGAHLGVLAKAKGIDKVVFDRSGYIYHGRVKALAEGARASGLKF